MPKTSRKTAKNAKSNKAFTRSNTVEEIKKNCRREMDLIVEAWEKESSNFIQRMFQAMNSSIYYLTTEDAEMTVEEYIKKYMINKQHVEQEKQPLKEVQANDIIFAPEEEPPQKNRKKMRKVPTTGTTRVTRSKKIFETPQQSKTPFVMVEGTPMLTKHDTSHLNLTDKPRHMKRTDNITAVGFNSLTLYSSHGSPMTMENWDDEMRKKVQETLQSLMQE